MEKIIICLTFVVSVIILLHSISSNYAIRGNELKHLSGKLDDVIRRIERIENWLFEKKE